MMFEETVRTHHQNWGPGPNKFTWTELCKQLTLANPEQAKKISGDSPLFMSNEMLQLKSGWDYGRNSKEILYALRPEDAIHIPMLRFDYDTGRVIEWNRSMADLTGISAAQVVGKSYAQILDEFIPNLTKEYKQAVVEWVGNKEDKDSVYHDKEHCRDFYLFPLPLPIFHVSSFENVSGKNVHYDEYVELLVAKTGRLLELYPTFQSYGGVPQCIYSDKWNFDASGWVGGVEFTLRRKQYVPSLQVLCRGLLPEGDHIFNGDGSLVVSAIKTAPRKSEEVSLVDCVSADKNQTTENVYKTISDYVRSCGPTGIRYIREVLGAVHRKTRNYGLKKLAFNFSTDWSSHPETSSIHKYILLALGGADAITEHFDKGNMVWTLNFRLEGEGEEGENGFGRYSSFSAGTLKSFKQRKQEKVKRECSRCLWCI